MIRQGREYRYLHDFEVRAKDEEGEKSYKVNGYASTFEPYVLFSEDGVDYSERIDPKAFDNADISDVIFLYNHEGMVYARQKNGTLDVSVDEHGLKVVADLGTTAQSRAMFEQIETGLIDQMSFAFTVADDDYDSKTHTRTITRIDKIYDVSAVSIPANPDTDISVISARDYFNGAIEAERTERFEREKRIALAKARYAYLKISEV